MEAADQVLTGDEIRSGFAAHRGVDLRQESSRYLNHRNAAHENRRQEPGEIPDNAAAEGDDDAGAVAASLDHLFRERLHLLQTLAGLAAGENQNAELAPAKRRRDRISVQLIKDIF